jgi:hypothetical protein
MVSPTPERSCEISETVFSGGAMRLAMTCRDLDEDPTSTRISINGRYTATSMDASLSISTESPPLTPAAQAHSIRIAGTYTARRLGDCPAAPAREN